MLSRMMSRSTVTTGVSRSATEVMIFPLRARRASLERRPPAGPGTRLLELRGEPEERGLVPEPPGELYTDRQVLLIPVERHRHRRLAGRVEDRRERHELRRPEDALHRVVGRRIEAAERRRRLGKCRREPHVVVDEEARDLTRHALEVLDGEQIVRGAPTITHLTERPGERLEPVRARRLAGAPRPVVDAPRGTRRPDADECLADRVALELRRRFADIVPELFAELRSVLDGAHTVRVHRHAGGGA